MSEHEAAAFDTAFQDELQDFHLALVHEPHAADMSVCLLSHIATLRAMAAECIGGEAAAELRRELHHSCVTKAAAWVEARIQHLVSEFHMRWHEDADLLAVDGALNESSLLVHNAEKELGPLPICSEVLDACEQQLCAKLTLHVRRANRHELRMLLADFCQRPGRDGLQHLCLDKYREQVDKHVQTEAVKTQQQLLALLEANGASTLLSKDGVGSPGVGGTKGSADNLLLNEDGEPLTTVIVMSDYLEGVAGLKEELHAADMPPAFVARVLREVEQEACTQVLELSSQVLELDTKLWCASASVQQLVDDWRSQGTSSSPNSAVQSTLSELDVKLEEAAGIMQLLQAFDQWCEDLPAEACQPVTNPPAALAAPTGASLSLATVNVAAAPGASPPPAVAALDDLHGKGLLAETPTTMEAAVHCNKGDGVVGGENGSAAVRADGLSEVGAAAAAAAAAVSACSSALSSASLSQYGDVTGSDQAAQSSGAASQGAPGGQGAPVGQVAQGPVVASAVTSQQPSEETVAPPSVCKRTKARVQLASFSQGLACGYMQGEVTYVECAVRLAAHMLEPDQESLTLSVVDDSFFVLLKAFTRSVNSGAAALAVVPLLNSIVDAIRALLLPVLVRQLQQAGAASGANTAFFLAVNSLQCADEYTMRLRSVVATSFEQRFPGLEDMAEVCLTELEALADDFREHATTEMRGFAAQLMPTAWLRVEFEPCSYVLASSEQIEIDARHSFEAGLLQPLRRALTSLAEPLRPPNMEVLVDSLAGRLATEIELCVMHKRFDEAGAILLCEHVRLLTDSLSEYVNGSVRNQFGRLNQIAFLLNAGSVQEAAALLMSNFGASAFEDSGDDTGAAADGNRGGRGARLTKTEAARCIGLRIEFDVDDVRELLPEIQ